MDHLREVIHDNRIILTIVSGVVLISCMAVLATEWNEYNLFMHMYQYIPCPILITTVILEPVRTNVSADIIIGSCYYTRNHPNELQIGDAPKVNTLLWIGIVVGLVGVLWGGWSLRQD